jgi:hypothetical protein
VKGAARLLSVVAALVGVIVVLEEVGYWVSHPHRPGPSAYIALCALGILLLAAAQLLRDRT